MMPRHAFWMLAMSVWVGTVIITAAREDGASRLPQARTSGPDAPLFTHSDNCVACHNNLIAPSGEDVSIGASWRGSIMANAARDPYFHASLRRETIDHPSHASAIEDECATCHLPTAQRIAAARGEKGRVFPWLAGADAGNQADVATLAQDGVTCTVCHQISSERLGTRDSFNGNFAMIVPTAAGNRAAVGPYAPDPGRVRIMRRTVNAR